MRIIWLNYVYRENRPWLLDRVRRSSNNLDSEYYSSEQVQVDPNLTQADH